MMEEVYGYKGFNYDWTCRGFQYEIGQTYEMDPSLLDPHYRGFHFCRFPAHVFDYYNDNNSRFALIKATNHILDDYTITVCSEITIVKEMTRDEIIELSSGMYVRINGDREFYKKGLLHCDGCPAIEYADGMLKYYWEGQLHRGGDLPAVIWPNGIKEWYFNGVRHRSDGPAIVWINGMGTEWWINGERVPPFGGSDISFPEEPARFEKRWADDSQFISRDDSDTLTRVRKTSSENLRMVA